MNERDQDELYDERMRWDREDTDDERIALEIAALRAEAELPVYCCTTDDRHELHVESVRREQAWKEKLQRWVGLLKSKQQGRG